TKRARTPPHPIFKEEPHLVNLRCHGLAPWRFTFAATNKTLPNLKMPRACPVEIHVHCYKQDSSKFEDATGQARGIYFESLLLTNAPRLLSGDHEGTLIVPCPPYKYAITFARPPLAGISLRYTCL